MKMNPKHLFCAETQAGSSWESETNLRFKACTGEEAKNYWREIASFRIEMFKEFPYLYEGNFDDEQKYLNATLSSKKCHVLLVFDQETLIGFSSANSLENEIEQIQKPFIQKGLDIKNYFYIAEVMIKESYRGMGLVRCFAEFNEECAKSEGYTEIIFMAIKRSKSHPLRPKNYVELDSIWRHFGYHLLEGLDIHITWTMVDTHQKEDNHLEVWTKNIP